MGARFSGDYPQRSLAFYPIGATKRYWTPSGCRYTGNGQMATARLPILTFHTLGDGRGVGVLDPGVFRRSMERLRAAGHRTVGLGDVAARVRHGLELPHAAVVLTFDDGDRSVYEHAFPVLWALGMTATVF